MNKYKIVDRKQRAKMILFYRYEFDDFDGLLLDGRLIYLVKTK